MNLHGIDSAFEAEADAYEAMFKALGVPYERSNNTVGAKWTDVAAAVAGLVARIDKLERKVYQLPPNVSINHSPTPFDGGVQ